jgi:LacI family transcriptional regulator
MRTAREVSDAPEASAAPDGRATIADVARQAGVSIATVSRVVNGRYGVAPTTHDRVRAAIDELGYEASLVARSLRSQQTNVIGVLVSDIEPFSAEVLKGVANALHGTDFELVVYSGGHGGSQVGWERRYLSRLSGTLTDGTILVTPTVTDVSIQQPVVAVDPHTGNTSFPTVASQNYEGAMAATRHLVGLGHTRIAFLGGRADLESARLREEGYRAALLEAGIAVDPTLIAEGGFRRETAAGPARTLLDRPDRPTALFAANDLSAIQTMEVAADLGLRVPDDLSVVGFDNVPESALTDPPLTTVDQSIQQLGEVAARTLIGLIESPTRGDEVRAVIRLPASLVLRRSTGRPHS